MKVCTYSRQTPLGRIKRLGIFFNETSIIDVNLVWRKYYELEGYYHAEEKANSTAPTKLSEFLKTYQESSI